MIDTRDADVFGNNTFASAGRFTQNSGSTISADDAFGNTVACRCVDVSPANGVCDSATCATNPVLNGSAIPAAVHVIPVSMPACS